MTQDYPDDVYPCQDLTGAIIAAAIEVHERLGPGFLESIYEHALALELSARGHKVARQVLFDVVYRGQVVGQHRLDLLVDERIVLELKAVQALADVHKAQLLSTLKAAGKKVGLLMNFNRTTLAPGIKRVVN